MKKLSKRAAKMRSVGKTMTYSLTLPVIGIGLAAIKTAAEFDKSMAQVGVATNAPQKQLGSLRDLAIETGNKTIFSANESAEAMLELAKSGISPAKIEAGALAATMSLAATEGLELGRTAEIIGATMNTFGLKAKQAKTISDALAGGANASSASVQGLAESLAQGGQSAAMYDLSVFETVGTLAAFAQNGIQASDAGTSFKTFMMRLNPVAKKQKELMNELGLSFFDSHGKMVGLTEVSKRLRGALGDMSQKQRTAALQVLFGSDAMRAANVVYKEGPKGLQRYIKATEKKGNADKMANAQMKGLPGAIERLSGSLETAALVAGKVMAPAIEDVAGFIEGLMTKFTELPEPMQLTIIIAGLVVAAMGPVLFILGAIAGGIPVLVGMIGVLGTALTFLAAHPIVLALIAIGVGFFLLYTKVGWFRDAVDAVVGAIGDSLDWLVTAFMDAKDWVSNAVGDVVSFVKSHWPLLIAIMTGPIGVIVYMVIKNWKKIKGFISGVVSAVLGFLKKNWPTIVAIMTGPVGILVLMIVKNWGRIKAAASDVKNFVVGRFNDMIGFFKSVPGKLAGVGGDVFGFLKDSFRSAVNWIIRGWNSLEFKIPGFDPPGPGPSFGGLTIGVPDIPELRYGGHITGSGWSIVGDAGPELMWTPRAAQVRPLSSPSVRIPDMVDLSRDDGREWDWRGETVIPITVKLDGKEIAKNTAKHSESKKARE